MVEEVPVDADPPLNWPPYRSTALRAPALPPVPLPPGRTELTGPVFGEGTVRPADADLTAPHDAIATAVPAFARDRLVAALDLPNSVPEWAVAYRFDLVLRSTPFEEPA